MVVRSVLGRMCGKNLKVCSMFQAGVEIADRRQFYLISGICPNQPVLFHISYWTCHNRLLKHSVFIFLWRV